MAGTSSAMSDVPHLLHFRNGALRARLGLLMEVIGRRRNAFPTEAGIHFAAKFIRGLASRRFPSQIIDTNHKLALRLQ
jgi:hypothetical protein